MPTAVTSIFESRQMHWSAGILVSMATVKKAQTVLSDTFMNALTSATQVVVPPKDASCFIGTRPVLCAAIRFATIKPRKMRQVISQVMRRVKRSIAMMLILTISNSSEKTTGTSTPMFPCSRTSFSCDYIITNDPIADPRTLIIMISLHCYFMIHALWRGLVWFLRHKLWR